MILLFLMQACIQKWRERGCWAAVPTKLKCEKIQICGLIEFKHFVWLSHQVKSAMERG